MRNTRAVYWYGRKMLLVGCLGVAMSACGGEDDEKSNPNSEPKNDEKTFATMTFEERKEFMTQVVVPAMKEVFFAFDPEEFPTVNCRTCHGANAEAVAYKMPNSLKPLDPATVAAGNGGRNQATFDFMKNEVTPKMAELLGEELYNAETGEGFGCFDCHATRG